MKFSSSMINKFMGCPLQAKFSYVNGIPELQNAAASYGTCVHAALEKYNQNGDVENAIEYFLYYWENPQELNAEPETWPKRTSYSGYREKGIDTIYAYHENNAWSKREVIATEHKFCLAADTQIITKTGLRAIASIRVGEEVLTHKGRWKRVTEVIENPPSDDVRLIKAKGLDPLIITGNHPLYAAGYSSNKNLPKRSKTLVETDWVSAADIEPWKRAPQALCHSATVPRYRFSTAPDSLLKVSDYAIKRRTSWNIVDGLIVSNAPNSNPIPASVRFTKELGNLLGLFLAEGHVSQSDVVWSFHEDEQHLMDQLVSDIKLVFGIEAKIVHNEQWGKCVKVIARSIFLADLLRCGTASQKSIPEWAWEGGVDFAEALLTGWIAGDGHITKDGKVIGATVSTNLAWHMMLLALSLGHKASIVKSVRPKTTKIQGRLVNQKDIYTVSWQTKERRPGSYRLEEDFLATPIRSNDSISYEKNVFNLEVEDDHSYLTAGGVVHNCVNFGDHQLSGIVDVIEATPDGKLKIVDLKTGRRPNFDNLYLNIQFTIYMLASTKPEFWLGFDDKKYPPMKNGQELYDRFLNRDRVGIWYDLNNIKEYNVGRRDDTDYMRLYRCLGEIEKAMKADVFIPSISADTCMWCSYTELCPVYITPDQSGKPLSE